MENVNDWPDWLKKAQTVKAQVTIIGDIVVWRGGLWKGGTWEGGLWEGGLWEGGTWKGGTWKGGTWEGGLWKGGHWQGGLWKGGTWRDGLWKGGTWEGGLWEGGAWRDGLWEGGTWKGGTWEGGLWEGGLWEGGLWKGGLWKGTERRLEYMAAMLGIVFDANDCATAYRTTQKNGTGRYSTTFHQPEGEYFEEDLPKAGSGTCARGIHVTTAARAWTYFSIDRDAQFWVVKFKREDLLDCDGEKCRIRGGHFQKIAKPF